MVCATGLASYLDEVKALAARQLDNRREFNAAFTSAWGGRAWGRVDRSRMLAIREEWVGLVQEQKALQVPPEAEELARLWAAQSEQVDNAYGVAIDHVGAFDAGDRVLRSMRRVFELERGMQACIARVQARGGDNSAIR